MSQQITNKISNSEYDTLINNSLKNSSAKEKTITTGKIISIENDIVTIDVGLKSEGRVPLSEFLRPGQKFEINVGDETEVFIDITFTSSELLMRLGQNSLSKRIIFFT